MNVSKLARPHGWFHTWYVRVSAGLFGDPGHLIRRHEEKLGFLVDEPGDEPGAGNAVDDRTFASNPFLRFHLLLQWGRGTVDAPSAG